MVKYRLLFLSSWFCWHLSGMANNLLQQRRKISIAFIPSNSNACSLLNTRTNFHRKLFGQLPWTKNLAGPWRWHTEVPIPPLLQPCSLPDTILEQVIKKKKIKWKFNAQNKCTSQGNRVEHDLPLSCSRALWEWICQALYEHTCWTCSQN